MPSLDFSQAWPWLQWVIAVSVVLGVIFGAIRGIPAAWKFISQFVNTINALSDLPEFIERTNDRIDDIHHEVHYNNGSSVKDAVARVETKTDELMTRLSKEGDNNV